MLCIGRQASRIVRAIWLFRIVAVETRKHYGMRLNLCIKKLFCTKIAS